MKANAPPPPPGHAVGPYLDPLRRAIRRRLARLPRPLRAFLLFGLKQAWACLFGASMLGLLIVTKIVWQSGWPIHRYDFLFICALLIQATLLAFRLESWSEARVILIFHVVGTSMELFKTAAGSWTYPEAALFRIDGVPLFTGFMYASVGSYQARVIRIFDMRFTNYPPRWTTMLLAAAIYANFYAHHFITDIRYALMAIFAALFWRVRIYYTVDRDAYWMPLILAAFLTSVFIWAGENVGTATGTWLYPAQHAWQMVPVQKLGSWFLLTVVSFVLVTVVNPPRPPGGEVRCKMRSGIPG